MCFFELEQAQIAHRVGDELGGVGASGQELGVRATVAHAGDGPSVVEDLLQQRAVRVQGLGIEGGAQPIGDRDVEHDVDRVFAGGLGDVADRVVLPLGRLGGLGTEHHDAIDRAGGGEKLRVAQRGAPSRVGELVELLLERAERGFAPGVGLVEQVPVLEGENEGVAGRDRAAVDLQTFASTTVEPRQCVAMDRRIVLDRGDDVVEHRTTADARQQFECLLRLVDDGRVARHGHLDETGAPFGEHLRELDAGLGVHEIGGHG